MSATVFKNLNEVLGIKSGVLEAAGVFNGFNGLDSPVYIDPRLLGASAHKEIQEGEKRFSTHFRNVFVLVEKIKKEKDIFWDAAWKNLQFPEASWLSLGLSAEDSDGSGIGPELAEDMLRTSREIINVGVQNPLFFELLGLFNKGIGPDRISDMTAHIIHEQILKFSQRVASDLKLKTADYKFDKVVYKIAAVPGTKNGIHFVPKDILRDIPIAESWSDMDLVAAQNAELRSSLNETVGTTWKQATRNLTKDQLKDIVLKYPELLEELISLYSKKAQSGYDFDEDPNGYFSWKETAADFTTRFPLKSKSFNPKKPETLAKFAQELCDHFKRLTEYNGFNKTLYNTASKRKHETYLQYGFYSIALTYCEPYNVKVNREPSGGSGPVDFELSYGASAAVNIELKFSNHQRLHHGWTKQLERYNKAQNTLDSFYLVVLISKKKVKQLEDIRKEIAAKAKPRMPKLVVVDGNVYPSASVSP
jgi:hypothetical protein